jgi:hypothetical protein
MHENREISSTPWSDDQGRSAKAINRTADMHVLEKSDCAVVPMNQPNKGRKPSAEVGEGRARAVENIVRFHMLPTQSGNCMSQGTGSVRQAALPPLINGKSRMRKRARTDLCGGGQQWPSLPRQGILFAVAILLQSWQFPALMPTSSLLSASAHHPTA